MTPLPPRRSTVGAIFLTVVVDLVGFGIVMPLLPLYAVKYDVDGVTIGLLVSSFSAMQFLFAPVWGRVSDRYGRRPVLLLGLAGSVISYTLFGLADSIVWLFVARIGAGICGATISTSAAYIADITPPGQRARGMALIGAAFGIGFTLGPPLGLYADHLGEQMTTAGTLPARIAQGLPGFIAALMSLISFIWTWAVVDEPPRRAFAPRALFDAGAFRRAASPATLAMLLLFSFTSVFAFSNFEGTLSLLLQSERFDYSRMEMGKVFLFIGISLALIQGFLVRRALRTVPERTMIRIGFALMALGLAGVAMVDTGPGLLISIGVAVTGFGSVTPSLSSLISRQADAEHQGGTMGLAQSASSLGRILGPYVGNVAFDPRAAEAGVLGPLLVALCGGLEHHRRPYVVAAAILAVLAVASLLLLPPPRKDDAGEDGAGGGN
jgi:MFS family permease